MKQALLFFGRYALIWLLFYMVTKGLFLLYQANLAQALTGVEIIKIFLYGSQMDISATGYMLLIPGFILVATPFIHKTSFLILLHKIYFIPMSLFIGFITVVDFELYQHWGFRLDLTPLNYIGKDTMSSTTLQTTLLLIIYWFAIFGLFYFCFQRFVLNKYKHNSGKWYHALIYLLLTASLLLPIRGSLDVGPMNLGFVYFHKEKPFANHAAINVFWNVNNAIYKASDASIYPENFVAQQVAQRNFKRLYSHTPNLNSTSVLKTQQPNILLIILEGFTAKIIDPARRNPEVTPNFNRLIKSGIFFNHYYASGDRTDKGLISILSGYPAQTKTSIIKYANKTEKLPTISLDLKKQGYQTSFVYGGDVNFSNINAYLYMNGFSEVIKKLNFDASQITSKWGVHDHIVFDTLSGYLTRQPSPFFTTMLTLSSHEPFDVPMETVFEGSNAESKFLNSAHYTDRALGNFIDKAMQTHWWANTLVVLLADHGNRHPGNSPNYVPERFHIPMLWLGGALNVQDTVIQTYGSQTDLAATLLHQLNMSSKKYSYSKDIINTPANNFAYYIYNDGFGYVDSSSEVIYDLGIQQIIRLEGDSSKLDIGKSYIQVIYSDFNSK